MKINAGMQGQGPLKMKGMNKALNTLMKSDMGMMLLQNIMLTLLAQQMNGGLSLPSSPNFGAGGGGGVSPASTNRNFLGGGGGGSAPSRGASSTPSAGPTVDPSSIKGGSEIGRKIAADAQATATGSGGYCFRYVKQTLEKFGISTSGASAYMAADQLARNPKVKEINVAPQDLKKLPPGAIVVWDRGNGHEHGHISIALGNGKEASDVLRDQITNYGTKPRVFIPKGQ